MRGSKKLATPINTLSALPNTPEAPVVPRQQQSVAGIPLQQNKLAYFPHAPAAPVA